VGSRSGKIARLARLEPRTAYREVKGQSVWGKCAFILPQHPLLVYAGLSSSARANA